MAALAEMLGKDVPWHEDIKAIPDARMDFLLESHAARNPERYVFKRLNSEPTHAEIEAAWLEILGSSWSKRIVGLEAAIAGAKAWEDRRRQQAEGGLRLIERPAEYGPRPSTGSGDQRNADGR